MTHWKRPWCWERLKAKGEEGSRGWDGWTASPIERTWIRVNSRRYWRTEELGLLQSMGSQIVGHELVTKHNNKNKDIRWKMFLGILNIWVMVLPFCFMNHNLDVRWNAMSLEFNVEFLWPSNEWHEEVLCCSGISANLFLAQIYTDRGPSFCVCI